MGIYKHDVIKIGAYIHDELILCGCLLLQFYSTLSLIWGWGIYLTMYPPTKHQKADNTFTLLSAKAAAFLPGHVLQKSAVPVLILCREAPEKLTSSVVTEDDSCKLLS